METNNKPRILDIPQFIEGYKDEKHTASITDVTENRGKKDIKVHRRTMI